MKPVDAFLPLLTPDDVGPPPRPRLLVVDDQPVNVQALYQIFAPDHQVLMATRGEQALALCADQLPDLVLLDVEMPDMDGHEICRRLKAVPATRDTPVIFVTAHDHEEAETRALDAGAVDFIAKPVNPRIVRARVKTHLTLKAQSDLLRQWVYIDGLTGARNRRCFDERLAADSGRAHRQHTDLSVLMIDVDSFKHYNDRHGHLAGDDVLRRVAVALAGGLRRSGDLLARYGGEEFACLLPETDLAGALRVAETLRARVQALGIEHADSGAVPCVTVSIGACCRAGSSSADAEALLRTADARLYEAKAEGRNRVRGSALPDV